MRDRVSLPARVTAVAAIMLVTVVVVAPAAAGQTATDGWSQRLQGTEEPPVRDGWSAYIDGRTVAQHKVTAVDGWAVEHARKPVQVATDGWSHRPLLQTDSRPPAVAATTRRVGLPLEAVIPALLFAAMLGGVGGALIMRHRRVPSIAG